MQHEQEKLHSPYILWFDPFPLTLSFAWKPISASELAALHRCCEIKAMARICRSDEWFWVNTWESKKGFRKHRVLSIYKWGLSGWGVWRPNSDALDMPCQVKASMGEMLSSRTACAVQGPCTGVPMATQSKYNKNTSSASSGLNYHVLVINTESRAELPGLLEPPEPLTQPQPFSELLWELGVVEHSSLMAPAWDSSSKSLSLSILQRPVPVLAKGSRSLTCVGWWCRSCNLWTTSCLYNSHHL